MHQTSKITEMSTLHVHHDLNKTLKISLSITISIHYKIHRQTKIISSFSSTSSWFSASLGLSALQLQEKWFSIAMIQKLSSFRAVPEKIIWKRFVCVPVCCFCSAWNFLTHMEILWPVNFRAANYNLFSAFMII